MVSDLLEPMMVERLQAYQKKNKALPERIFVFRDGVSEVSQHSRPTLSYSQSSAGSVQARDQA